MFGSDRRAAFLLVGLLALSGCGGAGAGNARDASSLAGGRVQPVPVSDQAFGERAYELLIDAQPSAARQNLLVGVVQRQIARAEARFTSGNDAAGLRALLGAFFLVRAGEFRRELLDGGARALMAGSREVARLGQEGYALAFYSLLKSELPPGPERTEVEGHVRAIEEFSRSTHGDGPIETAGNEARVALQRALIEATPEAVDTARERIVAWIRAALTVSDDEQALRNAERDEQLEGYRALRGGTLALVALYLRHGDPRGALDAIAHADLERLFPPELSEQIEHAADDGDPDAWMQIYRLFDSAAQSQDSVFLIDTEPMAAAAFGSALELYRARPDSIQAAMPLATQLARYGMAEVVSPVLTATLNEGSPPEHVSVSLALILNLLVAEDSAGQLEAARRTFAGAAPLLELAEKRSFAGRVAPSAGRVRYVMAAIEARHGDPARALPLIQRAVAGEPTVEALTMLASLERQRNRPDAALAVLDRLIAQAQTAGDSIAQVDALIHKFETLRDAGRAEAASKALEEALLRAVEAQRQSRPGPSQSRLERLLARVLEHYGNQPAVNRATQRAYEAANGDVRQFTATVLDASRRALTRRDLAESRAAAQRAIDAKLGPDEIVYVALWLQLLEGWLKVPSDGTTEEAYATIDDASGWPAKLRSWARGRLTDAELTAAARDAAERTEARFYTALSGAQPGSPEAKLALRDVAQSGAIDLIEVTIARDLLAPPANYAIPEKIAVP